MSKYNNSIFVAPSELNTELKRRFYVSILDPEIPLKSDDIYVITTFSDRLDLLAFKYYQEPTLWWIIAAANPTLRKDTLNLEIGTQVRIPRNFIETWTLIGEQLISR